MGHTSAKDHKVLHSAEVLHQKGKEENKKGLFYIDSDQIWVHQNVYF